MAAPKIDLAPAKCNAKITISTEGPLWAIFPARGGYTVQPVPAPTSTIDLESNNIKAGNKSQRLILLSRGKAISGAPSIIGVNQFPNPPIITGMTKKKIIINAWVVTNVLYNWSDPNSLPGWPSSVRIITLILLPINPDHTPNIRYRVPISLWFVDHTHRSVVKTFYCDTFNVIFYNLNYYHKGGNTIMWF